MAKLSDRISSVLARILSGVFFRRVEAVNLHRVPPTGALLVASNHTNGLIDPMLLLGVLPRRLRFLGKSTLWDIPPLRPFLALVGVIPVYRPTDPGVDPSRNAETFARTHEALVAGEAISLFPEGKSHTEPALQPLRTGAARMALGAARAIAAAHPDGGGEPVRVLPVGLSFDARERFRSRALVWVGEPFEVAPADPEDRASVRALTEQIEEAMRRVTANYRSWREAQLVARAARVWDNPTIEEAEEVDDQVGRGGSGGRRDTGGRRVRSMAERHRMARQLAAAYQRLQREAPDETAAAGRAMAHYDRVLGMLALSDYQIAGRFPLPVVLRFLGRSVGLLLLGLPAAAVGMVLNLVPYRLVGAFARFQGKSADQVATWKLFGALFLYPLFWLAEALVVGRLAGSAWAGVAAFALALPTGYLALLFYERARRFWREARAYLLLRTRPRLTRRLRGLRGEVLERMEALAGRLE